MTDATVHISRMLFISLVFAAFSASAADVAVKSPQSGNAFTRALLPGFTRPSLHSQAPAIAESGRRPDARFSLKPVDEDPVGGGAIADAVVVDNLLRFRF